MNLKIYKTIFLVLDILNIGKTDERRENLIRVAGEISEMFLPLKITQNTFMLKSGKTGPKRYQLLSEFVSATLFLKYRNVPCG